jgi:hypothetical protein
MKVMAWKIRGLNTPSRQFPLKKRILQIKPIVVMLHEKGVAKIV